MSQDLHVKYVEELRARLHSTEERLAEAERQRDELEEALRVMGTALRQAVKDASRVLSHTERKEEK